MKPHRKFRITEKDFLLANRQASREEEIREHGRQILFRTVKQKSKKVYDRKRLKKAGIGSDDLPIFCSVQYSDLPYFRISAIRSITAATARMMVSAGDFLLF